MKARELELVKQKFVKLMRSDPPPAVMGVPTEPLAPVFDRWVARRFTDDEVQVLFRLELEYGESAMCEWFSEVLVEAGLAPARRYAN